MVFQKTFLLTTLFTFLTILSQKFKNVEAVGLDSLARIVTDLNDVFDGVPLDFRYNESDHSAAPPKGGLFSAPGCPKSVEGYPWLYYGSPVKCYLAGEQGPCEADRKLFVEYGSPYGYCNCNCFEDISRREHSSVEFCTSSMENTEYAFILKKKACFALYDQGPCKTDEWLVKSTSSSRNVTICESRKCPDGQYPYYENAETTTAGSRNFSCFSPISPFAGPVSILANDCGDEMNYSKLLKKCVRKLNFNFG